MLTRQVLSRRAALQTVAATGIALSSGRAFGTDSTPTRNPSMKNSDFYIDGAFSPERAFEAYYAMMQRFGYPIPPSLRSDQLWTSDFAQNDFANVGMAGIFWINDKVYRFFAHEILLLPGQMIVEHRHNACAEGPPKMESWHVRHGQIHTFGEGTPTADLPCRLPESQLKADAITVRRCTTLNAGEVGSLNRQTARHFMVAGPEGAIVAEYGTPHYDDALEFTNSTVVF